MSPFFSIIIPTYNCANLLNRALKSVFSQTFQDYEVIVIDNSSTDNTENVLYNYKDIRLKVIKVNNNGIIAISRNQGIDAAIGNWIAFLDSDDVWLYNKLDKVRQSISDNTKSILVCHDEWHFDNNKKIKRLNYGSDEDNLYESLLFNSNCISTSAVCINTKIAKRTKGFSENVEFVTVEDYEYWIRLAQIGEIIFIDEVLGEWHTHGSNESGNPLVHAKALVDLMNYHYNIYAENHNVLGKLFYKGRAKYFGIAANMLRREKYYDKAIKYSKEGIKCYPLFWKNWVVIILSYFRKIV